jgi:hypothetical protein
MEIYGSLFKTFIIILLKIDKKLIANNSTAVSINCKFSKLLECLFFVTIDNVVINIK